MTNNILEYIRSGNNLPPKGAITFDSSDHVRFQNGRSVTGHNYGANRRFVIEKNIEGGEGYTITMYNLDGNHPFWQNNIQMAPKRMRIESINDSIIEFRGYGSDSMGASFADYGVAILIENNQITRLQLNMYDRNISIVYLP